MPLLKAIKSNLAYYSIIGVSLISCCVLQYHGLLHFAGLLVFLFSFALFFLGTIRKLEKLTALLIFIAPFSFSLDITEGFRLNFPIEFFTIFLFGAFFFKKSFGWSTPSVNWKHPLVILMICDVLWTFFSALCSEYNEISLKRFVLKFIYIGVYFFIFLQINQNHPKRLLRLYSLGMIIPVILIIVRHSFYGFSQNSSFFVSQPFFDDHTQFGAVIAFIIPYCFIFIKGEKKTSWLHLSILAILLFAVTISYSRAAWISLIAAAGFYLFLLLRIKFYQFILILILAIGIGSYSFDRIYQDLKSNEVKYADDVSQHLTSVTNLQNDPSNLERINRWVCAIRMFEQRPIYGWGPGTYQFTYDQFQTPEFMTRISTHRGNRGNAHSDYLTYLSEQGIIGLLIFLSIVLYSLYLGMKLYYQQINNRKIILSLLLGLITFFVHGFFNTFGDIAEMTLLIYGSLAILYNLDLLGKGAKI